jgi:thiamine transport system permease protein
MAGLLGITGLAVTDTDPGSLLQSQYIRRVLFFSVWQAGLSTLLSAGIAILVARAFAHRGEFRMRGLLLRLFGLPLVVPAVVVVMGIVSVYGSNGWIPLGRSLYGLTGILLAHVFFNLPLAVRLLLPVWQSIPEHHWQLSNQLGLNQWQQWKYLEWPALRETLPGVGLLVFMLCLTSFAVVLTLGGGPRSTTLEVAIYQSLRFDFDPARAVVLALLQLSLCIIVALLSSRFHNLPEVEITLSAAPKVKKNRGQFINTFFIGLAGLFVALPLLAMFTDALNGPLVRVLSISELWRSAAYSLMVGVSAASLSVIAGWALLNTSTDLVVGDKKARASFIELAGSIVYVVPPLVVGTGLFVLMMPWLNVFEWVFPIVILINAMMGLPFVIRTLGPAMRQSKMRYNHLCASLALSGWNRFKSIDWPLLRRPLGLSAALVAALAMGDLGVIALFGSTDTTTLPLLLYRQLAAYQMPQAAVTAAFLLLLCLLVFWLLESLIGGKPDAKRSATGF